MGISRVISASVLYKTHESLTNIYVGQNEIAHLDCSTITSESHRKDVHVDSNTITYESHRKDIYVDSCTITHES